MPRQIAALLAMCLFSTLFLSALTIPTPKNFFQMNGLFKGVYYSQGAKFISTMYVDAKRKMAKSSMYDVAAMPSQESQYFWVGDTVYKYSPHLHPNCIIVPDYDDPWNDDFFEGANRSSIIGFRGIPAYKYEKYGTTQVVDANTGIVMGVNETIVDLNMEFEFMPMTAEGLEVMVTLDDDFAKFCEKQSVIGLQDASNVVVQKAREMEKRKRGLLRYLFPL